MSLRLLSFLSDIERALQAGEAPSRGTVWDNIRTVNYHHGLARISLAVRRDAGAAQPLGTILLQSFRLADGTICLKAFLSWAGNPTQTVHAIYERTDSDWAVEARRISSAWRHGFAKATGAEAPAERLAAAG